MDFELGDEQRSIAETARDLLAKRGASEGLWDEMCDLGWPGIAVSKAHGGLGLGLLELAVLIEQHGYACASTPLLGSTLAALVLQDAGTSGQAERWLPRLLSGAELGALAIADPAALAPDGASDRMAVLIAPDRSSGWVSEGGALQDVEAIDPTRRHGRPIRGVTGEPLRAGPAASLDRAAIVVAAELVGLCRRALDMTISYVKERTQFGVPVGSFQAVQHAAAQMLRDTEVAATTTYYAAWVADNEPAQLERAAAVAKAAASAAGRSVTASAIQLHGGIGFTWEADLHWLFKRAQVDAVYLGGSAHHQARLARFAAIGQRV